MNISSLFGIFVAISVIYFGVFAHSTNKLLFLDQHALLLVVGGTLAAAFIAFPIKSLARIVRFIFLGFFFKIRNRDVNVAIQILHAYFQGNPLTMGAEVAIDPEYHPFLAEGLVLLKRRKFTPEEIDEIMKLRIQMIKKEYNNDAKVINALAKFPPAFGLLGASTGMIAMMTNLKGGAEKIGPSMAVALVATFWGIALANLLLLPLADFAFKMCQEEVHTREMIAKAIFAIAKGETQQFVYEKVAGYVPIQERPQLRERYRAYARASGESGSITIRDGAA